MDTVTIHPFAEVWPLMDDVKLAKLAADIKAHGLLYPILLYRQQILDGRNRYLACLKADVEPRFEKAAARNDDEALDLSASLNEHRRHLPLVELAFIGAQLANLRNGLNIKAFANAKAVTLDKAARTAGVSKGMVNDAIAIKTYAPELEAEVKAKKKPMRIAANEARARGKVKRAVTDKKARPVRPDMKATRNLTRQDVDPEFVGDGLAFVAEYGHVLTMTSLERSSRRLSDWAIAIGHLAKTLRNQQLPPITDRTLLWLRAPSKADVTRLRQGLAELDTAVQTARALLEWAELALEKDTTESQGAREHGA